MAKNLRIDSTDSALDQRIAALQPYNTVQLTIVTAAPSVQRQDGALSMVRMTFRTFRPLSLAAS